MKKIVMGCAIISVMLSGCWRPPYGGGYDGGRHGGGSMEMRDEGGHGGHDRDGGMERHDDGEGRHY